MPDSYPRTQLCLMLKQYGLSIMAEPKRCKSLLSDLAPQHRLETFLLITALEQKIAEELLKPSTLIPIGIQLERLAQSLRDAVGIEEEYAYWAVESWALALNVIQQPTVKQSIQPELDALLLLPTATTVKPTRHLSFIVFSVVLLIAGIFIASVFAVSSKTKHENNMTKPPVVKNSVIEQIEESQAYPNAIEQTDARSQNSLGDRYYYGVGVDEDYQKAVVWYRKAAEQGNVLGQCNLGFMYANGYGVAKDYQQAVAWYRKAAEQGNADGQNNLGIMYENGDGVAKDTQQAIEWYRKAVEQGHYGAQQTLKTLLERL